MQAAERRDALGAGPQHQMIGVAEHDIGAGRAHVVVVHALDRRLRADRHEGWRAHRAVRRRDFAGARGAVGGDQAEGEGSWTWELHSSEQQTRIAIGIEAIAAIDGVGIGAPHDVEAAEGETSMNSVERGRWKLVSMASTARKR